MKAALRAGTLQDAQAIRSLLEANALPTSDLVNAQPEFIVAFEGPRLIGCAALQRFDRTALVRSVAVSEDRRGTGLGQALVHGIEERARSNGVTELVLLTQTARDFFEKRGYQPVERASVHETVQASEEFRSLCPQSAVCLRKKL